MSSSERVLANILAELREIKQLITEAWFEDDDNDVPPLAQA